MEFTSEEQFNSQAFSVCPCSVIFRGEQEQGKSVNVNVKERERGCFISRFCRRSEMLLPEGAIP